MDEALLIGNNMAVLVAASELARQGRRVALLTDGKPLGGHFAGMRIGDERFDVGMVMLEKLAPTATGASLQTYDAHQRNDWTRFADRAAAWLDACEPLLRTPTPQSLVDGRRVPDHLIANRLEVFHGAAVQVPVLERSDPRHAAHKTTAAAYEQLSYAEAAEANHGAALQAHYIEPFVRKLTGHGSDILLARYHRAAWAPLYYPETLAAAQRGEPVALAEYPFWTPRSGCVGDLVARVCEQVASSPLVRLVTEPLVAMQVAGPRWSVATASCEVSAQHVALGLSVERARALLGLAEQPAPLAASVVLMVCRVRSEAIRHGLSCLMVVDEDWATYRVTDQDALAGRDPAWHRVVVEASPDCLQALAPGAAPQERLVHELQQLMGLEYPAAVQVLKTMHARNVLALPTPDEVARAAASHQALAAVATGAQLTGGLLGYGVMSMNDQIVQGLKLAEDFA